MDNGNYDYAYKITSLGMKTNGQDSSTVQNEVAPEDKEQGRMAVQTLKQTTKEVLIYPNPTTGNISVAFSYAEPNADIYIYNTLNQLVFHREVINEPTLSIDFSMFNKGVYFIKVNSGDYQSIILPPIFRTEIHQS